MRHKPATADRLIAETAARQNGVVSVRQLLGAGLTRSGIARRVQADRLHRVHRGVYAVGHPKVSQEGRWIAAVLACGMGPATESDGTILDTWGAALSHRSGAELWGLLPPSNGTVDISVAGGGGREKRDGIRLHRSRSLWPTVLTLRSGIPVTTPGRTISDLSAIVSKHGGPGTIGPAELRRAVREADVLGLPTGPDATPDRTRSELESEFMRLCRRHRLPEPAVNLRIGPLTVDFCWVDRRLVIETDGYRYHRGRAAFEDDRARDLQLRALGYDVVRLSHRQVLEEPSAVATVLRAALEPGRRPR